MTIDSSISACTLQGVYVVGQLVRNGSYYAALVDVLGAFGQGRSRDSACEALVAMIPDVAADHGLRGLEVEVTHDGASTLYVSANDPKLLVALLLRSQRTAHDMSLADVIDVTGAKSRNAHAQYETGRMDPSITKLQELLDVVAPDFMLAIIPRNASVIPRWEPADDEAELQAVMRDPSPANIAAFQAKAPLKKIRKAR